MCTHDANRGRTRSDPVTVNWRDPSGHLRGTNKACLFSSVKTNKTITACKREDITESIASSEELKSNAHSSPSVHSSSFCVPLRMIDYGQWM